MKTEDFVKNFYLEKKSLLDLYFNKNTNSDVSHLIDSLQLDDEKKERVKQIINSVLRDAFYTILLGLDGEAQIGTLQETYKIEDKSGDLLTGGQIEGYAWEYFHNNKYELDNSKADFIATLTYRTTEQGGRIKPAFSGYRPGIKFDFEEMQTSGAQTFIDRQFVFPGDTVEAEIKIISVSVFANRLSEGMSFEFKEGPRVIGIGKIKHIINQILKKQ